MDIWKPLFNGRKQGGGQQHLKQNTLLKMCLFILYGPFKLPSFKALYYPRLYVVVLAERLAGFLFFDVCKTELDQLTWTHLFSPSQRNTLPVSHSFRLVCKRVRETEPRWRLLWTVREDLLCTGFRGLLWLRNTSTWLFWNIVMRNVV